MLKDQMATKDMDVRALSDNELDTVNGGVLWLLPPAFLAALMGLQKLKP